MFFSKVEFKTRYACLLGTHFETCYGDNEVNDALSASYNLVIWKIWIHKLCKYCVRKLFYMYNRVRMKM